LEKAIPHELRAERLEDVGTAVLVNVGACDTAVGVYVPERGSGGLSETATRRCDRVSIIDMSFPAIIEQKDFYGNYPPARKAQFERNTASGPLAEVTSYVLSLPRK
jgi:hypothetical protein